MSTKAETDTLLNFDLDDPTLLEKPKVAIVAGETHTRTLDTGITFPAPGGRVDSEFDTVPHLDD